MQLSSLAAIGLGLIVACGGSPPPQSAAARSIQLSEQPPPSGYVRLRELAVTSGKGCGVLGVPGSREGAEALLRDEAAKLGARYVQVTSFEGPRPNHQCLEHEHKLGGVAYRAPADPLPASVPAPVATATSSVASAPAPSAPPDSGTTTTAPASTAPPRVCVPGATQACLGPGACQGAQACRDDASGYLPCDCGPGAAK